MTADDPWKAQLAALGELIRSQRKLARLSLRELSELTDISNPYLSQIERGLHEPSVRVLRAIGRALNLSAETLLAQAGLFGGDPASGPGDGDDEPPAPVGSTEATEAAIRADGALSGEQKEALLAVYRSYVADNRFR